MTLEEKTALKSLYTSEAEPKDNDTMAKTPSKRQPRLSLEAGTIIEMPSFEDFTIMVEKYNGFPVETFGVVYIQPNGARRVGKFFVSWLENTGFEVFFRTTDKAQADAYTEAQKQSQPIEGYNTAHSGTAVTMWQSAGNQLVAKTTFAGGQIRVESIFQWVVGKWDKTPKPCFILNKV